MTSVQTMNRAHSKLRLQLNRFLILFFMSVLVFFTGCVSTGNIKSTSQKQTLASALKDADAAYQDSKWPLAVRRYQKVIALWPEDTFGYFRLGNAQLQTGDIDGAIHSFETAIGLSPNDARVYNNLSIAHLIRSQDLLLLLNQKLRPTDVSARRSVEKRLQLLDELLATPILGISQ